ncbi:hypothetical protein B9P99_04630 [Candidatus Marsarchaeota G1 archaeon OSP_B]|jgi:predicted fused transcriptional regulator/phosphomethylpyrimidine kinase/predicted transcriptional regulator|uniref:Thiamine-phosphate synthase ThiN domain-containing protein n=5 Tax=Candidatus Marsarchaeota TaxID=1978152 RepID=A0A2R6C3Y2_9ARCH|nr:MAG: hypothetical protein B9Q01_03780 [Candidatus Marsarchaeota G1 archaeon OSP_D]PSN86040.1 MAG: hypothetical protein B9Q02_03825 [Candidatus Marsarchaeota G1 archaeon BE_D]PSN90592.1 MAG: hypothetical protein B9P99_04630 [Candidatus Marsarchaeota G1 archaeon OSP_B]PSO05568.1 MAG: hypothetical protein B9Q12_00195 [Candidatus Marsarchaeota G2 archaeon ECH_B_SAG-G06]
MRPPCEVMVKKFLPAVRALVAHALKEEGLEQEKIARMVGVTQAMVSYYLAKKKDGFITSLARFGLSEEEISSMVSELKGAAKASEVYATELLYSYWRTTASSGGACELHRAISGDLTNCDLCMRVMVNRETEKERRKVINAVKEAAQILEASPIFGELIPEVYSNIVYCIENPRSEEDVAAIPGRIIKLKGKAKALMNPEFGASKHLARLVLALRSKNAWVRAALNTRFEPLYLEALKQFVKQVVFLKSYESEDQMFSQLKQLTLEPPIAIVVDPGSKGYEPNIYIVGVEPVELANIAVSASTLWKHRVSGF